MGDVILTLHLQYTVEMSLMSNCGYGLEKTILTRGDKNGAVA